MDTEAAVRELDKLAVKLLEVEDLINDYESNPGQARMIQIKLHTTERRLSLITLEEPVVVARKLTVTNFLEIAKTRFAAMQEAIDLLGEEHVMPTFQTGTQMPESVHVHKHVPVIRWGIQFHGETKDLSLGAFLERVKELMESRHITEDQMWLEASDLFTGPALVWYRSARRRLTSWKELLTELEREFQPHNYDEQLKIEISRRTQGAEERLGIYFASLDNLFYRLTRPLSQHEQLSIAKRNLLPYYADRLLFQDIPNMAALRHLCQQIEHARQETACFRPPPEARNSLEPDLGYTSLRKKSTVNAVSTFTPSTSERAPTTCWNCNRSGHRFRSCRETRKLNFCQGCGKTQDRPEGTQAFYCTSCLGKGRGSRR
jgi:Retrotransposon gag protein